MTKHIDVVIAGAGPAGLLSAIELTLGGAKVVVLERLASPSQAMKALSFGPLAGEALLRRGMRAAVNEAQARGADAMRAFTEQTGSDLRVRASKFNGHFAGLSLIRRDAQVDPDRRPRHVDQPSLEAMLAERARALGIDVRREHDITAVEASDDSVQVRWTSPSGDGHLRADYLIGCDGGRSTVRKLSGFAFPGTEPTLTFYQAIADVDHPELLVPVGWNRTAHGVFCYGPVPGRLFMLDFSGPPRDRQAPVIREEIEEVLRRTSGKDVRVNTLHSASRWADNTRLVDTYRLGRVFLAGDAAHVHSPFGGQGLSLGLLDAANLGWKLAAVIRGDMPDSLLCTYTAERRPVAEAVLANTRAQVAILRPDPQSGAMRDLIARLMDFDDVNRFIGEMMTGVSTRYDLGGAEAHHPDIGRLAGDWQLADGVYLYDAMQEGNGVLLDATPWQRASQIVAAAAPSVRCVTVSEGPSMLLRPDACIAWRNEDDRTDDVDGLRDALRQWFAA
ncbi:MULTISPECIES: FAD-dependent monooxygenase [Pandoraea]|uniref:FAD-dependent monooxygenase n=1 Tax=Pandoraea TaxID=93217 RepID=UPI001F5C1130|nr:MULTISPECIES: FAD-dependent monooxygenase [Pandoraea]MCI3204392.1 FAD-binding monooxygenase [Pandoraea sp. LA3]MDN4582419.1 FAD-binding monooxygenase [Pandoraea capi]